MPGRELKEGENSAVTDDSAIMEELAGLLTSSFGSWKQIVDRDSCNFTRGDGRDDRWLKMEIQELYPEYLRPLSTRAWVVLKI